MRAPERSELDDLAFKRAEFDLAAPRVEYIMARR